MLESTEKGEVRKTVGNYRLILMNDPNLQGAFRLNMFTDKIDITRDLGWYRESDSLTDVDLKFLVVYLEKHYGLSNEKRIEDVIKVVANENRYHPVLDRINSITWDGRERIRYALHHFLGAEVSEYTYEVMKLFMIGTIARISCPGIKFEVMLCLVGGQGAGKSTFLRFLAMEDDWFTDDLKKMDDDNVYRKIQGHLIIEFPEMVAILNAKNVEDGLNYQKLGRELMSQDRLALMDGGKCILQVRGVRPFFSDKVDITANEMYKELSDFDKKNQFDIEKYVSEYGKPKFSKII